MHSLCQYSTASRSEALSQKEESFYTGSSKDQQTLKKIFEEFDTADLVSIQIHNFITLLELC